MTTKTSVTRRYKTVTGAGQCSFIGQFGSEDISFCSCRERITRAEGDLRETIALGNAREEIKGGAPGSNELAVIVAAVDEYRTNDSYNAKIIE